MQPADLRARSSAPATRCHRGLRMRPGGSAANRTCGPSESTIFSTRSNACSCELRTMTTSPTSQALHRDRARPPRGRALEYGVPAVCGGAGTSRHRPAASPAARMIRLPTASHIEGARDQASARAGPSGRRLAVRPRPSAPIALLLRCAICSPVNFGRSEGRPKGPMHPAREEAAGVNRPLLADSRCRGRGAGTGAPAAR